MHDFTYKGSKLFVENVAVESIVEKTGTPAFIYSYKTLADHFLKLRKAFSPVDALICYSIKSNSNIAVVRALQKLGSGFDVVSGGELFRACAAGADPKKIVFAGVGKSREEIEFALRKRILFFTVESGQELETIAEVAGEMGAVAPVALRVNPDVDPQTHQYISTGKKENKFGLDFKLAYDLYRDISGMKTVKAVGVHMHIGSQITAVDPYLAALDKMAPFIESLKPLKIDLKYFDIGGGLGIIYHGETPQTADSFAREVLPRLKKLDLKIVIEPGRFISGNAGILAARVRYVKKAGKHFVIVDAGMNDLIRPSLYSAYHEILPLNRMTGRKVPTDVVGPICESGDFFAKDRMMPDVKPGDYVAVMSAGAYGFSMSSNYNSRPRACEILVKGKECFMIRERETYRDLTKKEKIPKFLK
jgi:diaminopimelate decarboxylase